MVTANQGLTNVKEELRLTNQTSSQLAQVLNMTLIMIHYIYARGGHSIVKLSIKCEQSLLPLYYMPYMILKIMIYFLHIHDHQ